MGKPKNKAKDNDVDSDVDIVESEATEAKPVGKQSKKDKKKKKKDDDWEDDVANELQSLSLEANKGRKEENSVEEERAPVKKKEKKKKKKQQADSEEEEEDSVIDTGGKRGKKMAAFNMLMMEDEDTKSMSEQSDNEEEPVIKEEVNEQQKKKDKKKDKKKGKEKQKTAEEDLDALLAEIDAPKMSKKAKKEKKKQEAMEVEEKDEGENEVVENVEVEKVEPKVVSIDDYDDDEDDKKKRKKKKDKGKKEVTGEEDGDEEKAGEGEGEEEGGTVKSAAQKKKEKKEKERLKKLEQKKKQALKKDGKVDEPKSEEKTEDQGAAAEDKAASGDDEAKEEEDDSKKKKKKKKGEKEEKPKKSKAPVAAIKELLKRQKEEEERLRQEEEERIRKEEEAIAAAIEKKRLEEEKRKLKKQKEKERKERLKAEGKLLTAQQKQEKLRQQQMLESMKAQGLEIKTKEEEVVEAKKKRPIYEKKKKKPQQKQDDSEPTDKTPSPEDTPAQTPVSEEAPSIVETPEAENSEAVVDTEEKEEVSDIKDELDISSEEEEEEKEEKESSPEIETKAEAKGKKVEVKVEDEDEESDDDENDDGDENESESESDDDLTPYERAEIKLKVSTSTANEDGGIPDFSAIEDTDKVSTNQTGEVESSTCFSDIVLEDTFEPLFGMTTRQPSLFGTGASMYGQLAATGTGFGGFGASQANLFGMTAYPNLFGTGPSSMFCQPTGFGGFGVSQANLFGMTTRQPNLFDTGPSMFGQPTGFGGFGVSQAYTRVDSDLIVRLIVDLQLFINVLGINWSLLSLMIATDNNRNMIGISEENAKINVIKHFKDAREKLKRNEISPYDITLSDIVARFKHLQAGDIHWLCIVNSLINEKHKEKKHDVYKVLSSIFKKFPDFDTFWSALSMPHYDCEDDRFQANNPISKELKELKSDINVINISDSELSETVKEDKKFCSFLNKQNLVNYAKKLNLGQYCLKFLMFCMINVDIGEWERYINKIGIIAVRKKKSVDHFCLTFCLENRHLLGQKIISEYGGEGSLGYVFYIGRQIYHITSSHILVDETIFKKMKTSLNQVVDIENQCKIEGIGNSVISKGVYSKGDSQSAGIEIVLVDTSFVLHVLSNHFSDPTAVPVPPRQTKSRGSVCPQFDKSVGVIDSDCPQFNTPVTGATGSDWPQFDTIKMGRTRPASFDTISNKEVPDTSVIDGGNIPSIGFRYYQWKCHDLPDHLYFKGNIGEDIEIDSEVYILGAFTDLTKGKIIQTDFFLEFDYPSKDKNEIDKNDQSLSVIDRLSEFGNKFLPNLFTGSMPQQVSKVTLKNQYKVEWDPFVPFSKEGDSGAAVFKVNKETGELTAVGILTANNATEKVSYVTPIKDIVHNLQANGLNYELGHFKLSLREQGKDVLLKLFSDLFRKLGIY